MIHIRTCLPHESWVASFLRWIIALVKTSSFQGRGRVSSPWGFPTPGKFVYVCVCVRGKPRRKIVTMSKQIIRGRQLKCGVFANKTHFGRINVKSKINSKFLRTILYIIYNVVKVVFVFWMLRRILIFIACWLFDCKMDLLWVFCSGFTAFAFYQNFSISGLVSFFPFLGMYVE